MLAAVRTYGVDAAITRGSNNYGPNQYPEKLIPLFTTNLLDGEPVPVYGDGRQSRDFIYVEDHCAGIETVLERGASGEIYNVGGGNEIENLTTTTRLLELTGRDESHIRYVTDRPGHDRRYALDTSKLQGLGWRPEVTFDEGLELHGRVVSRQPRVVGADQERRRLRRVPAQAVRLRRQVTEGAAAPGGGKYRDALGWPSSGRCSRPTPSRCWATSWRRSRSRCSSSSARARRSSRASPSRSPSCRTCSAARCSRASSTACLRAAS